MALAHARSREQSCTYPSASVAPANRLLAVSRMICRIWHEWTSPERADAYERLLREVIFVGIAERAIVGFRSIELLRRKADGEEEFVTAMWFDSFEAVREFAGADLTRAVVPPAARALLSRFDARAAHYEVVMRGTDREFAE